ncbi:MAG: anti-sigma factor family protein, partial [Planctomycetota bacterium]
MNTEPNHNPILDNPDLTAYALGELEADRVEAIERLIAENEQAARFVAEIKQTADALNAEFEAAPRLSLGEDLREAIEEAATQDGAEIASPSTLVFPSPARLGIAACLMLGVGVGVIATLNQDVIQQGKLGTEVAMIEPLP